ncbi:MAG TPA: 2-oxo acid dehydrogenase subunit E2 [Kofleriaceae bacterium]|nr:2-oxo acid dehydrogenase subunit E2 [Kofleriaceae bacterium]
MPLFRRPDGVLIRDESNVRKMMPYLMRGRNESAVYHEQLFDLSKTRPWLRDYNRSHPDAPATLFHLHLYAYGRTFHERPGLNRFISGGRIYQRNGVELSFAAKKVMDEHSPLVTVKMKLERDEDFASFVKRMSQTITDSRSDRQTTVDKELRLALALPGPMLRFVMAVLRGLDSVNLLPGSMIKTDPMYATAFVGNLGSIGLDNTFHHLYEYGTISFFAVIGTLKKAMFIGRDGQPVVKDAMQVRWTFDERINDGFYCASALKVAQGIVEDPERHLGSMKPAAAEPVAATAPSNGDARLAR